jgi:hypothetical protein
MADDDPTPPTRVAEPGSGRLAWIVVPLATFLTANSAVWLQRNLLAYPPTWDQATYLTMSLRFWHAWQDGGLGGLAGALADSSAVWPPLFPLSTAFLYALVGESRLVAHLTNGVYLMLLLAAIQSLTAAGYGPRAGALAVLLACGFSDVVRLSRDYLLDFPASALLAAAMAALARSGGLGRRRPSVAFGAAAGLTALTKTMTGVFMVAPLLRLIGLQRRSDRRPALRNLGLAAVAALVVAGPWWLPHFGPALGYLVHYGVGSGAAPYATGGRTLLGVRNLTYYGWVLVNNAVSFPSAALIAGLLVHRAWRRWRGAGAFSGSWLDATLWTWLLAGYVVLTLVPNKGGDRYALFLLPPLAALYAGWLCSVAHRASRLALVALALAAASFNYVAQTWGIAGLPRLVVKHPVVFLQQDYPHLVWMRSTIPLSADTPWPVEHLPADAADAVREGRHQRARAALRAVLASGEVGGPESVLRLGYRTLLGREPDPGAEVHRAALRSGTLDAEELFSLLARSDEFASRRVRVLVVPDHPVVNAATLGYYAERARIPVRHAHPGEWPAPGESLAAFDAAILKQGGWQGPEFTTRSAAALAAALTAAGSGYRKAASWPCPDGSRVVLLVRG